MPLSRPANPRVNPTGESIEPAQKPERVEQEPQAPRVSAILVGYNQAPALRRAIEALEHSRDRDRLEILVVDCGSRDESTQLDADYPAINMLRLPHHLGAARAMNIATRTAKADLLFYISPDVEVGPDTVSALADRLQPHAETPDTEIAAVCPLLVDAEGHPASRIHPIPTRAELSEAARGAELPNVQLDVTQESITVAYPELDAVLIRKHFVRSMNYFDQRFGHYWADADLAMQIRRAGKQIRLFPAIRATYHPASDPLEGDALARADRVSGAAALVGKYEGTGAALSFRLVAVLSALARFDLGLVGKLTGGQKLDGSQAA
ncbi:MAG: glycosyltransferase-like protein [Bryobacterales bacterium]|nr:glycosyltransferase-like protein [Bryobacterales bacterium]